MGIFLPPTHLIFPKSQRDLYEAGIFLFPPPPHPFPKLQRFVGSGYLSPLSFYFLFVGVRDGTFVYVLFLQGGVGGGLFSISTMHASYSLCFTRTPSHITLSIAQPFGLINLIIIRVKNNNPMTLISLLNKLHMKVLHKTKCYFFAVTAKRTERKAQQIQTHV